LPDIARPAIRPLVVCNAFNQGAMQDMLNRVSILVAISVLTFVSGLHAEPVPVVCTILPGELSASVLLTNTLKYEASCLANCKFSTPVYDDNPQIVCAKPVPAGKQVEMCILKAAGNKLIKLVEATADCRRP
jgi:hypothetical protein